METHFASPERLTMAELSEEVRFVANNPIITALMQAVSGLLAVLNEHRQILAVNETLLELLEVGSVDKLLGTRLGEVLSCVHACEMPGGCGTSRLCSTCGAVIAMVASLSTDKSCEKTCAMTVEKEGKRQDLYFKVRAVPVRYDNNRFLLMFVQDITYQQRLTALDRVFFHDISNIIHGLVNGSQLLYQKPKEATEELSRVIYKLSIRLASEVAIQKKLSNHESSFFNPTLALMQVPAIMKEVKDVCSTHPLADKRGVTVAIDVPEVTVKTDMTLFHRVIGNMVTNALEETEEGGEIRLHVECLADEVSFCVWNKNVIPANIAMRIFQRNFSTKAEMGRGLGTYSMKLFGEEILGGKVSFTSAEAEGTTFRFTLKKEG